MQLFDGILNKFDRIYKFDGILNKFDGIKFGIAKTNHQIANYNTTLTFWLYHTMIVVHDRD